MKAHYFIRWKSRNPLGEELLIHVEWASCCPGGEKPESGMLFQSFEFLSDSEIFLEQVKGTSIHMGKANGTEIGKDNRK